MASKKVLFIDYIFPPVQWGWRAAKVAKYLKEMGWEPLCLCCDDRWGDVRGYDYGFDEKELLDLETYRIALGRTSVIQRIWRRVQARLKLGVCYPDAYQDWLQPAYHRACQILDCRKIDLLYNVSPPYTTAFLAERLKKRYHIPWVVDFRDPRSISHHQLNYFLEDANQKRLMEPARTFYRWRILRDEKRILQLADKILYPSQAVNDTMQNVYPEEAQKMEALDSGYDESTFQDAAPIKLYPGKLTITWMGQLGSPYLEAVKLFIQAVRHVDRSVELVFIGRGTEAVSRWGFENVTCIAHLPRERAHRFAFGSDFLFLVMPFSFKDWDCSKTYSYFRIGRPILALVHPEGAIVKILKEAKTGRILPFEFNLLCNELKTIFEEWRKGEFDAFKPDSSYFRQYEQRELTKKLAGIFDQVTENNSRDVSRQFLWDEQPVASVRKD